MACYHLDIKIGSRSAGQSAVASAAYRAGEELEDERNEKTFDYSRKGNIDGSIILAPSDAPEWCYDRGQLWNRVEAAEKRKDAQVYREIEVSIPRELTKEQGRELVEEFAREVLVKRGMVVDISYHSPPAADGKQNRHAHMQCTTRHLENGKFGGKAREWNKKEVALEIREKWGEHANLALERAGHDERIDHRSLKTQKAEAEAIRDDEKQPVEERVKASAKAVELDRTPEPKIGHRAAAMAKRGGQSERVETVRSLRAERKATAETVSELASAWKQKIEMTADRAYQTIKRGVEAIGGASGLFNLMEAYTQRKEEQAIQAQQAAEKAAAEKAAAKAAAEKAAAERKAEERREQRRKQEQMKTVALHGIKKLEADPESATWEERRELCHLYAQSLRDPAVKPFDSFLKAKAAYKQSLVANAPKEEREAARTKVENAALCVWRDPEAWAQAKEHEKTYYGTSPTASAVEQHARAAVDRLTPACAQVVRLTQSQNHGPSL